MFFGGVEGGATHSNLIICDENGQVLGRSTGPGTNHWTLGIDECVRRILTMLRDAKTDAGIPEDKPLDSLGLTLSGCEQESSNTELAERLKSVDSNSALEVYVASDTAGSLATAAPKGGMVIIAGTGSNAFLETSNGERYGCGGWGHLLGDEGGAYWIAHRAVKTIFDYVDGLNPSPYPTDLVWKTVQEHFKAENRADLLPHAYKHFEKSFFAGLTVKLADLASNGDLLSKQLFYDAGAVLMAHAAALASKCDENKLRVVCVGSVWNSWELMKIGALKELARRKVSTELELVRLRVSSAMGACYLAAKKIKYELPRDDDKSCEIFYTYKPTVNYSKGDHINNGTTNSNGNILNGV